MSESNEILEMARTVHTAVAYKLTESVANKAHIVANELERLQADLDTANGYIETLREKISLLELSGAAKGEQIERLKSRYGSYERLRELADQDKCKGNCYPDVHKCPECMAKGALNTCGEIRDSAIRDIEQALKDK